MVLTQGSNTCKRENWSDVTTFFCVFLLAEIQTLFYHLISHLFGLLADGYACARVNQNCSLKGLYINGYEL